MIQWISFHCMQMIPFMVVRGRMKRMVRMNSVYLSLRAFLPSLQNKNVLVRTDNMSAVYHINHQGGTRSARCLQVIKKLLSWSSLRLLSLKAVYISEYVQSSSCEQSSRPAVSNCTLSRRVVWPILRANLAPNMAICSAKRVSELHSL